MDWKGIGYLAIGAIAGAIIGVICTIKAQKPNLVVQQKGSGGNQEKYTWNIGVSNRPSFFGTYFDGESAYDVYAQIRLDKKNGRSFPLYWGNHGEPRVTIEAGKTQQLIIFHYFKDSEGYFLVDQKNEPVAQFKAEKSDFILTLSDRFQRRKELKFTVNYDDTHLGQTPNLSINFPITLRQRIQKIKSGFEVVFSAFK